MQRIHEKNIYHSLVHDFNQQLNRELNQTEKDLLKWMAEKHATEHDKGV